MQISDFNCEEDFKGWYSAQNDCLTQIQGLKDWRLRQLEMVPRFKQIVGLLAGDQYTKSDRFILELLQNADDNEYDDGCSPTLKIILDKAGCDFISNETGFTAENVFAITYAAESTKARQKTGRTFIGEKGIGFKSLFAVASEVEIHSRDYHFKITDEELFVPRPILGEYTAGSHIRIHFKPENPEIPSTISRRLDGLMDGAGEFMLFLQKLCKVEVEDRISGKKADFRIDRSFIEGESECAIHNGQISWRFRMVSFAVNVPSDVVNSRFEQLHENIDRDMIFAVPLPNDGPKAEFPRGKLYCFLPTEVYTGMPIHIHLDAKTTTNRENLVDAHESRWNKFLFEQLPNALVELFRDIAAKDYLRRHLPRYLPKLASRLSNEDLNEALKAGMGKLKKTGVFLDRHGKLRLPIHVVLLPKPLRRWLRQEKYERVLTGARGGKPTFLAPEWEEFENRLDDFGVRTIDTAECLQLLTQGAPDDLSLDDSIKVRQFLQAIMDWSERSVGAETFNRAEIRLMPIFPIQAADGNIFMGKLGDNARYYAGESQPRKAPENFTLVAPDYTYALAGSSRHAKSEKAFNKRFRRFLDDLGATQYSERELILKSLIPELQSLSLADEELTAEKRREITITWWRIYTKVGGGRGRENNAGDLVSGEVTEELKSCRIPARLAGTQAWTLIPVSEGFIGKPLGNPDLDRLYKGTGAPSLT